MSYVEKVIAFVRATMAQLDISDSGLEKNNNTILHRIALFRYSVIPLWRPLCPGIDKQCQLFSLVLVQLSEC